MPLCTGARSPESVAESRAKKPWYINPQELLLSMGLDGYFSPWLSSQDYFLEPEVHLS